jgi:hypothetical protein
MARRFASPLLFAAIGVAIYGGLYLASERLVHRTGHANPFFKIARTPGGTVDWLILGASHAMPLDFADFEARIERETGLEVLNLAAPGAGPLYNRFVLEEFLRSHRARNLLYVVDSFAFYSRTWNEDRFADAKLLRRTPFDPVRARRLWGYSRREGVDPRAVLDYLTGFSKINDRERFRRDEWEGEAQFDRAYRPSASATRKRIEYLYPDGTPPDALARRLETFSSLVALARDAGARVVVLRMPVPRQFREALPEEAGFEAALSGLLAARGVPLHDLSATLDDPRFYLDSDHLGRAGVTELLAGDLGRILRSGAR